MDQETAKDLFFNGGIFILLNVPPGTEFGVDMKLCNTGEKFRGVKMIPPGLHYIFYSSVSKTGDVAPRTGFFHNFHEREVLVKKWDTNLEDICLRNVDEDEVVGLKENILALDKFLGPYPYDIYKKWINLTSHITERLVNRLIPECGIVRSAVELIPYNNADEVNATNDTSPSTSKKRFTGDVCDDLEHMLPNLRPVAGTGLRFTSIPKKRYPDGADPSEITKHCMDSTYTLETLLEHYDGEMDLMGELEFCFICFLVGHSLESFEQWKKLIILLCSCEEAISKYNDMYYALCSLLEIQIHEIPEEFLADIVSNNNFMYIKLRDFFRTVMTEDVGRKLKAKVVRFQNKLTQVLNWDFTHLDSDDEEDAPLVIDLQCT